MCSFLHNLSYLHLYFSYKESNCKDLFTCFYFSSLRCLFLLHYTHWQVQYTYKLIYVVLLYNTSSAIILQRLLCKNSTWTIITMYFYIHNSSKFSLKSKTIKDFMFAYYLKIFSVFTRQCLHQYVTLAS